MHPTKTTKAGEERMVENQTLGVKCFFLEVPCVGAAHILLARTSHVIMSNYKKVEKSSPPKCSEEKRKRSQRIYAYSTNNISIIFLFILRVMKPILRKIKNSHLRSFV